MPIIARAKPEPYANGVALVSEVKYKLRFGVGMEAPKTIKMVRKKWGLQC